jgi:hypothetical protein
MLSDLCFILTPNRMTMAKKTTIIEREALKTVRRYFDGKASIGEAKKALKNIKTILQQSIAKDKKRRKKLKEEKKLMSFNQLKTNLLSSGMK